MPKKGFSAITTPDVLVEDIDKFIDKSNKLISSRSEALKNITGTFPKKK